MPKYMIEGSEVDTNNAAASWADVVDKHETAYFSKYTGSAYHRATLYKSRRGRYYMVHKSSLQREPEWAEWLGPERATVFFLRNKLDVPIDLQQFFARIQSVCEKANTTMEDLPPLEIAQHLADWVVDHCKRCTLWSQNKGLQEPCVIDGHIEQCLAADKPGCFAKHNYSTDKRYDPMDFRHWNVCDRMTYDELADEMRKNQ